MTFASNARFRRSSNVVSRTIGNELLVVPIRGGVGDLDAIFSFNGMGSDVWALLENGLSIEELVDWVVENYESSRAQVKQDLSEFLGELLDAGLVTVAPDSFIAPEYQPAGHASR